MCRLLLTLDPRDTNSSSSEPSMSELLCFVICSSSASHVPFRSSPCVNSFTSISQLMEFPSSASIFEHFWQREALHGSTAAVLFAIHQNNQPDMSRIPSGAICEIAQPSIKSFGAGMQQTVLQIIICKIAEDTSLNSYNVKETFWIRRCAVSQVVTYRLSECANIFRV